LSIIASSADGISLIRTKATIDAMSRMRPRVCTQGRETSQQVSPEALVHPQRRRIMECTSQ
jgi:hypothetical protein